MAGSADTLFSFNITPISQNQVNKVIIKKEGLAFSLNAANPFRPFQELLLFCKGGVQQFHEHRTQCIIFPIRNRGAMGTVHLFTEPDEKSP